MRAYGRQIDDGFKFGAPGTGLNPLEFPKPAPLKIGLRRRHDASELGVDANEIGIGVIWLAFYSLMFVLAVISTTP